MTHRNTNRSRRNHRGFTLVELMFVVAILMLLLAILTPATFKAILLAKKTELRTFVTELGKGVTMYRRDEDHGYYPGQQFGDSMQVNGLTGSEILAEAMWEDNTNGNGRLDVFPPTEKYLAYTPEHILIDGSRYFIADPSSKHVDEDAPDVNTQRIIAYYPSIMENTGGTGNNDTQLATVFYRMQNNTNSNYTPSLSGGLPRNRDSGKFQLWNSKIGRFHNYSSYLLVAPFRNSVGQKDFFMEYNVTNIGRD